MKKIVSLLFSLFLLFSALAQEGKWVLKKYSTEPDLTQYISAFEKELVKMYLKNKTKGSYYNVKKDGTFTALGIYQGQTIEQSGTWKLSSDKKFMILHFIYQGQKVSDKIEIRSLNKKQMVVAKNSKEYGYDITFILTLKKVNK